MNDSFDIAAATSSLAEKAQAALAGLRADRGVEADADALVPERHVFCDLALGERDDMLRFLSEQAVSLGLARDVEVLMQAFLKREVEGTTGMMDGFAIPHAKSATVECTAVLVAKDRVGVTGWDTMDELPVRIAIALLIPDTADGTTHLRLLSQVAEALMDEAFRDQVKSCDDPAGLAAAINARLM